MRIALNMLFVGRGLAGGRVYCEGLLKGLAARSDSHEYLIFTRRDCRLPELPLERFRQIRAPISDTSTLWRTFWEYGLMPRQVRRLGADLVHGLGSLSSFERSRPLVLTVHDLVYLHFPRSVPLAYRLFMHQVLPRVARRADRIIVPSRATAEDAVRHLGVPEDRVRLICYGPGRCLGPVTDEAMVDRVLAKFGIRRPYVLSVGRNYPHKNLEALIRAMAVLRARGLTNVQLVWAGDRYRNDRSTHELGSTLVLTGTVTDEELAALYTSASVFAFPSLIEGFGLPVIEAMSCGTPVVAADSPGVAEAVDSAGLLINPKDPELFADGLASVLQDEQLQVALREKGWRRAQELSWERCAKEVVRVYEEVLGI